MPDGPEQEERDLQMRVAMEAALREVGEDVSSRLGNTATVVDAIADAGGDGKQVVDPTHGNANQWADKEKSRMQFGYDADVEAENWWAEHGERTIEPLARM